MLTDNSKKLIYWDFFKGKLQLETSLHIGTSAITVETDAPLLRDACGRFYIPGTSVTGALRARAEERFKEEKLIRQVFGWQDTDEVQKNKSQKDTGQKSKLFVEDAICPDPFFSTVRDGVGIDRKYGTARPGAKYDLEITPSDLEMELIIRLETRDGDDIERMRHLMFELMQDFQNGNIRLGAEKSRGLGRCRFDYHWRTLDFGDANQVRTWLIGQTEGGVQNKIDALPLCSVRIGKSELSSSSDLSTPRDPSVREIILSSSLAFNPEKTEEIDITLEMEIASGPFLIKDGREDGEVDAVFVKVRKKNGRTRDYIPGSSVKGVFRSRAEKILRTLGGSVCDILDASESPSDKTDGSAKADGSKSCSFKIKKKLEEKEKEWSRKRRSKKFREEETVKIIREIFCPICRLFGNGYWASHILFSDAFFEGTPKTKRYDNVAIDRFTGGAAEGKLFDAKPVVQGKTSFQILLRGPGNFDKALLLFLLRDLKEGFPPLRFGYGKTKGYGLLNLVSVKIKETKCDAGDISMRIRETKHDAEEIDFSTLLDPMPGFHEWWKGEQHDGE